MTQKLEIYKCNVCGNIVEVLHAGQGRLVCCGQNMQHMKENTVDASREKHVPSLEVVPGGIKIRVGSLPHPMEEKHYIEWIEAITMDGSQVGRRFLKPGEAAEATFALTEPVTAREFCNLHLLWRA
ncbi:MAG: desulfoferrodoxin [candidate division WOR-3 bacterium]